MYCWIFSSFKTLSALFYFLKRFWILQEKVTIENMPLCQSLLIDTKSRLEEYMEDPGIILYHTPIYT